MNRKLYIQLFDREFNNRKLKIKQEQEREQLVVAANALKLKVKVSPVIKTPNIINSELKTHFEYTCYRCQEPIVYDTLFLDDFAGKYIPLDRETMRPHKCTIQKKLSVVNTTYNFDYGNINQ